MGTIPEDPINLDSDEGDAPLEFEFEESTTLGMIKYLHSDMG